MDTNTLAKELAWIECELSCYRKGYITVRLDFVRNLLTWKESNRWFNNFVRALSADRMAALKNDVIRFIEENPSAAEHAEPGNRCSIWHVELGREDSEEPFMELGGEVLTSPSWRKFCRKIEIAGQRSLDL